MNRRTFAATTTAFAAAGAAGRAQSSPAQGAPPFKLNYAPGFRHFVNSAGKDPLDLIQFMYDHGFRAIEDNQMMMKDPALQQKIGDKLASLGMTMGEWVTAEAIVKDGKIQHIINGEIVMEYSNPKFDDGTPVTHGRISLQAESHPCQFRNIQILELD